MESRLFSEWSPRETDSDNGINLDSSQRCEAQKFPHPTGLDMGVGSWECYGFVNWTGDVDTIGNATAAVTTITAGGNYSITANFEEEVVTFPDPNLEEAIR